MELEVTAARVLSAEEEAQVVMQAVKHMQASLLQQQNKLGLFEESQSQMSEEFVRVTSTAETLAYTLSGSIIWFFPVVIL
jgi:hypothetical protein